MPGHLHVQAGEALTVLQLRGRVWPVLLGVDSTVIADEEYGEWASGVHRDSSVIDCDVQRSLWSYTAGEQAPVSAVRLHRFGMHLSNYKHCLSGFS